MWNFTLVMLCILYLEKSLVVAGKIVNVCGQVDDFLTNGFDIEELQWSLFKMHTSGILCWWEYERTDLVGWMKMVKRNKVTRIPCRLSLHLNGAVKPFLSY